MKKLILTLVYSIIFSFCLEAQVLDPVHWSYSWKPLTNNTVEILFTAKIDEPFHMYGSHLGGEGPIPTSIKIEKNQYISLPDSLKEVTKPIIKYDPNFEINISLFSKKAVFSQKIELKGTQKADVKATIEYMACDEHQCLPPKEKEFVISVNLAEVKSDNNSLNSGNQIQSISTETKEKKDTTKTSVEAKVQTPKSTAEPKNESLLQIILLAFFAGLTGVLTPCVYPMIPMTISFFLRDSEKRFKSIIKGLVFGISIIFLYTLVGVIVAVTGSGPSVANAISTHWIPNSIFFLLFFLFAASFFGMFEFVLPSSLINKADRRADKGDVLGVFFMAFVTVLVSFACTGPIVGSFLFGAAIGDVLKPIVGMFSFGFAFALPFTVFAIFPTAIQSLPKSGGWLNSVKVVLGFLILAFSLKFVVNIDQAYHLNLLSREVFLSIWIALSLLMGFYLLGKIKFSHDTEVNNVTFPRMILALVCFGFTGYLFTGFLGSPLSTISAFLPPQSQYALNTSTESNKTFSSLCENPKYSDILHLPFNLHGYFDYKQGIECASKQNKPVFLDFKGHTCSNCKAFENKVWADTAVRNYLNDHFIIISLYEDDRTRLDQKDWTTSKFDGKIKKTIGQVNSDLQIELFKTNTMPFYVIRDSKGNPITDEKGVVLPPYSNEVNTQNFLEYLKNGVKLFYNTKSI